MFDEYPHDKARRMRDEANQRRDAMEEMRKDCESKEQEAGGVLKNVERGQCDVEGHSKAAKSFFTQISSECRSVTSGSDSVRSTAQAIHQRVAQSENLTSSAGARIATAEGILGSIH